MFVEKLKNISIQLTNINKIIHSIHKTFKVICSIIFLDVWLIWVKLIIVLREIHPRHQALNELHETISLEIHSVGVLWLWDVLVVLDVVQVDSLHSV